MESDDSRIKGYIKSALQCENFSIYEITLTGSSGKCNGYAGNIIFATVLATTAEGNTKIIEVVAKINKYQFLNKFRNAYQREARVYQVIIPEFIKFQMENNIRDAFNSVPKLYKAISEESAEVLVMEDLKKLGYCLYDRKKPLDINHLKCVLREYGKFHAISFAMREKKPDQFKKLVTDFDDVFAEFIDEKFKKTIRIGMQRACDIFEKMNNVKTHKFCVKMMLKGPDKVLTGILETTEPDSAILHGDCWNNNFVYKYEDETRRCPSKVAILDWQISRLHSPVLDLSYFIYSTSSEEQLGHFDELLDIYYDSFSKFLKEFDCDAKKLFPFSTLKRHWEKYGLFGVITVTSFLQVTICETEDAPVMDEEGDVTDFLDNCLNVDIKNKSEFQKRLVAVVGHYCKYVEQ